MARVAVIDSQVAGIAGDMLVSALVDAGASASKVTDSIFACQDFLTGSKISKAEFKKVNSHGFSATRLLLKYSDSVHERTGSEMQDALAAVCKSLRLGKSATSFASDSLRTIITAEARIHGEKPADVHLHEASSIDTLADLVGAATALQDLKLFEASIFSTGVAVGGGLLEFSHGTVPNPAAAILEIFKGKKFSLVGGGASTELTTPTGAAMLVNLARKGSVSHYPSLMPDAVGYGAGTKKFDGFANVVRVVIGTSSAAGNAGRDSVSLIETNLDDATGEVVGNLVDRLAHVSLDVMVIPGTAKKGRPAHLIRIISETRQVEKVLEVLFAESGTLGARVQEVSRYIIPREVITVPIKISGKSFNVHVKVSRNLDTGEISTAKPEFEDVKMIAARCEISVRRTLELVKSQIEQKLDRK